MSRTENNRIDGVQSNATAVDHSAADELDEASNEASNGASIKVQLGRRGHAGTSWDAIGWQTLPNGVVVSQYRVGDPDDITSPAVFNVFFPPECHIEAHSHDCDYSEFILEGAQKVSGHWYHAGDIRIAKANQVYGPLIAGPEGVRVIVIFKDGRWPARPVGSHAGSTLNVDLLTERFT